MDLLPSSESIDLTLGMPSIVVYSGLGKELPEGLLIDARLGMETMTSGEPFTGSQGFKRGRGRKGEFHL